MNILLVRALTNQLVKSAANVHERGNLTWVLQYYSSVHIITSVLNELLIGVYINNAAAATVAVIPVLISVIT